VGANPHHQSINAKIRRALSNIKGFRPSRRRLRTPSLGEVRSPRSTRTRTGRRQHVFLGLPVKTIDKPQWSSPCACTQYCVRVRKRFENRISLTREGALRPPFRAHQRRYFVHPNGRGALLRRAALAEVGRNGPCVSGLSASWFARTRPQADNHACSRPTGSF
jgi:hypothetical protein